MWIFLHKQFLYFFEVTLFPTLQQGFKSFIRHKYVRRNIFHTLNLLFKIGSFLTLEKTSIKIERTTQNAKCQMLDKHKKNALKCRTVPLQHHCKLVKKSLFCMQNTNYVYVYDFFYIYNTSNALNVILLILLFYENHYI